MSRNLSKKMIAIMMIVVFCICFSAGCGSSDNQQDKTSDSVTVTDAQGNRTEVPKDLKKIAVTPLPWSSVIYAIDGTSERMVSINPGAMGAYDGQFLETLDENYGQLDTKSIGSDFSINIEQLVEDGVQVCVIWDYQTEEAEKLKEVGIAPIMVKNETVEQLQDSLRAIGQMLGKEERAQKFIDEYTQSCDKLLSYKKQIEKADKPKVLYLRDRELKLQGNDNFIRTALELAGADNIITEAGSITMEEILKEDPDIILLSNFDSFVPDDLYKNRIEGQDWSAVSAVKNMRVYKVPMGIYRWDAPGVETPLMMKWLAQLIQPEIFDDINIEQVVSEFFEENFDITLSDENMNQIMKRNENESSK